MNFDESCKYIGGKVDTVKNDKIEMKVCILEDEEMAISENGDLLPVK